MAVALTNAQRATIRQNADFQSQVKTGMFDKAKYWIEQDGATPPGGDRVRWVRSRNLGADLINAPANFQADKSYDQSIVFIKDRPVNPSDDQNVFDIANVITHMLSIDEFGYLADKIFDEQIKGKISF